jgi:sugar lactone lactonase YvrE
MTKARNIADGVDAGDIASSAVTTDKIADNAITLAKMASGTDGNLISYDTAGDPVAVATGTVGQVLTSAGAGAVPSFATPAGALNYVAVTGETPSLDVGSYNFFDRGVTSANTTVSFASVPTEARWTYSFEVGAGTETYEVDNASFEKSFSLFTQDIGFEDIFFKPDGTIMYIVSSANDSVYQYALSTAWDIGTASYTQSFSVTSQETFPTGLFFKSDGTEMYVLGSTGDNVNQYTLSVAWDISSATYTQAFSVAAQEASPQSLFFKPDGTEMYVCGSTGDDVNQYTLSTGWDISTASYTQVFSVATQEANATGLFFKPDGLKMYLTGTTSDSIFQYTLSAAWDISSATFASKSLFIAELENLPRGLFFKSDGSKMYVVGSFFNKVLQYNMGILHTITLPASVENPPRVPLKFGARVSYDFFTKDAGTTVTLLSENQEETTF